MGLLKIFTFNIRVCVDKGANDFDLRKHRIAELINSEKPDIVGFQEATDRMREELSSLLDGYYVVGCGREKNYCGESAAVAYRRDKFELLKLDNTEVEVKRARKSYVDIEKGFVRNLSICR